MDWQLLNTWALSAFCYFATATRKGNNTVHYSDFTHDMNNIKGEGFVKGFSPSWWERHVGVIYILWTGTRLKPNQEALWPSVTPVHLLQLGPMFHNFYHPLITVTFLIHQQTDSFMIETFVSWLFLKMHSEMLFTNLLGTPESNQFDNQNHHWTGCGGSDL